MKVTAVARRSGDWWAVEVPQVPGAFTQARRLEQVPEMAADAVALLEDVPADSIEVEVEAHTTAELDELVGQVLASKEAADAAQAKAAALAKEAVARLLAEKLTVRDAGALLRVSYQRVAQLTRS